MPVLSRCFNAAIVVVIVVVVMDVVVATAVVVANASHKEHNCSRRAHKRYTGDKLQLATRNSSEVARA